MPYLISVTVHFNTIRTNLLISSIFSACVHEDARRMGPYFLTKPTRREQIQQKDATAPNELHSKPEARQPPLRRDRAEQSAWLAPPPLNAADREQAARVVQRRTRSHALCSSRKKRNRMHVYCAMPTSLSLTGMTRRGGRSVRRGNAARTQLYHAGPRFTTAE